METRLAPDFKEFLALLNSETVEYLLVGGYAVGFYGFARPTSDLDVWVAIDDANVERLRTALEKFGFGQAARGPDFKIEPGRIFRMGHPPVRIKVLTGISGVEFRDCYSRRKVADYGGLLVTMIDRDDLLRNKRAAGRHKDLHDIEQLELRRKD